MCDRSLSSLGGSRSWPVALFIFVFQVFFDYCYISFLITATLLPREQRSANIIEDIVARLKRLETSDACAPTIASSTTYADAAKSRTNVRTSDSASRRTDTVPPVVSQPQDVRKRRANEQLPTACDDTCPTPGHVTSSLLAEAMGYDGEGFSIPPEHAKKAGRREMREKRDVETVQTAIKKHRKFTIGKLTSAKLISTPRRYELFVFRVNENTTADDIKDYISCDNMAVIDIDCMSNENHYTKSYRIVVEGRDLERLYDPEFWPDGVCGRRFRHKAKRTANG